MSLHQLAQEVQSRGRGDDKVLMHVTPGELGGLQSLAMKHGGSLTINPETGLPEAGFLKNILPTLLGVGLSFVPGVGPLMAAGIVGGGTALATGSLQKGLMAGLGAYGGAGMGAGLASLGGAGAGAAGAGAAGAGAAASNIIPNATTPLAQAINTAGAANVGTAASNMGMAAGASPAASIFAPPLTAANQAMSIAQPAATMGSNFAAAGRGLQTATSGLEGLKAAQAAIGAAAPYSTALTGMSLLNSMRKDPTKPEEQKSFIRPYEYERTQIPQAYAQPAPVYGQPFDSSERNYFTDKFTALTPYEAPGPEYKKAGGGMVAFQVGGPVEAMSAANAIGGGEPYPQSQIHTPSYSTIDTQHPMGAEVVSPAGDVRVDPYTGEQRFAGGGLGGIGGNPNPQGDGPLARAIRRARGTASPSASGEYSYDPATQQFTQGAMAPRAAAPAQQMMQQPMYSPAPQMPAYQTPEQQLGLGDFYSSMDRELGQMQQRGYAGGGGVSSLGDYSDGGRLLKGPGNGTSDSIPAIIGNKQPARLAEGEFVIPARIVSELGNGSTDAGAKQLYAMMDRIQRARRKTIGKNKVAADAKARNLLPA